VRVAGRPAINQHPLYLEGAIEIQDEASQLVCLLLAPKRREMVVDLCAGAGGKSLLMGALMRGQGRVYAFDVSEKRLDKLKPRLARSGLSNIYPSLISNESDARLKRLSGKIDRVLVDTPCSGFGTLRRNPDLKWRQSPESIEQLKLRQTALLQRGASLLKPGGRLVYATCSVLREENQGIVVDFLGRHSEFEIVSANTILAQQHIPLDTGEFLELYPHVHGTDGFFAAALTRTV
jgi:16S rRNA (cytosine967-C5)-methyltransferase